MCSTTGTGAAKNRAFSGVISAPPVSSDRRAAPAITGTALSTSSAAGTSRSAAEEAAEEAAAEAAAEVAVEVTAEVTAEAPPEAAAGFRPSAGRRRRGDRGKGWRGGWRGAVRSAGLSSVMTRSWPPERGRFIAGTVRSGLADHPPFGRTFG
ncbi:hypothetical protein GCM10010466_09360 [Planomonospora alba]|uniref:Uncharacterized protein n=1 Tax=Planomonospora alba TaxID=161354 RepID=A0ABP6MNL2_9ACTN